MNHDCNRECGCLCTKKQVSWTAVFVGALFAVGFAFLLNLFSIATGLSFTTTDKAGMATLAVGGFIGLLIGSVVSMFCAGFVSGYLGRHYCVKRNLGFVYGFATWCVALVLTVLLATQMGRYVTVYTDFTTKPTLSSLDNKVNARKDSHMAMMADHKAPAVTEQTEQAANSLGIASYLIFALFFLGAFSCALGGHYGMTCHCRHDD